MGVRVIIRFGFARHHLVVLCVTYVMACVCCCFIMCLIALAAQQLYCVIHVGFVWFMCCVQQLFLYIVYLLAFVCLCSIFGDSECESVVLCFVSCYCQLLFHLHVLCFCYQLCAATQMQNKAKGGSPAGQSWIVDLARGVLICVCNIASIYVQLFR